MSNFTEADAHSLGVAKTAHILRLLHKSVDYAQEVRRQNRRRQTPRQQLSTPSSFGMPSAPPSEAPSSFVPASIASQSMMGGSRPASLAQVSSRVCESSLLRTIFMRIQCTSPDHRRTLYRLPNSVVRDAQSPLGRRLSWSARTSATR